MKSFTYEIKDPIGLHARPAGNLVKKAKEFQSKITVSCNGKSAEATRLMALMSMCVKNGMTVNVEIEGPDEDVCFIEIEKFFTENC